MNEEKLLIGIDNSSRSQAIGSLIMAMVTVNPDFFRKFAWLKIRSSKLLNRSEIQKVIETTQNYVELSIEYIKPKDINQENLDDFEMRAIINLLNQRHKFWKHKIFIDNFEKSKKKFIERFIRLAPENLKIDKLNIDKWTIMPKCNEKHKICSLASCYAKYYNIIDHDDIKSVWGDFSSGEPSDPKTIQFLEDQPDCPHIRKSCIKQLPG